LRETFALKLRAGPPHVTRIAVDVS
jgi:hypothetical protein